MTRSLRAVAGAVLVAFSAGCFGTFALTRKLWNWNNTVSPNKWVKELVFFVFAVVPVYGLAALGDALIFNSIEFWSGNNPIADGKASLERTPEGVRVSMGDRVIDVTVREDGAEARDEKGALVSRVETTEDGVVVRDGEDRVVLRRSGAEIESLASAAVSGGAVFARLLEQQEAGVLVAHR